MFLKDRDHQYYHNERDFRLVTPLEVLFLVVVVKLPPLRRRFDRGITPVGDFENERAILTEDRNGSVAFPFFI